MLGVKDTLGNNSLWIFGDDIGPTLLDAHTVPLVARLYDAGNDELMDGRIKEYGKCLMESDVYNEVMESRPTLYHLWRQ